MFLFSHCLSSVHPSIETLPFSDIAVRAESCPVKQVRLAVRERCWQERRDERVVSVDLRPARTVVERREHNQVGVAARPGWPGIDPGAILTVTGVHGFLAGGPVPGTRVAVLFGVEYPLDLERRRVESPAELGTLDAGATHVVGQAYERVLVVDEFCAWIERNR